MICIVGNRPVLQVGRQQVTGYGTQWLRETILRGAVAAEREDFPFIDDLLEGIIHYLENKCPLRVLTVEDLHARVRRMLERIGCEAIAQTLPLVAPPVTLSLVRAAKEAANGFELAFFNQIHDEIEDLKLHGVEELHFTGTRDCVKVLRGVTRWTSPCEKLHEEIITFLKTHGHSTLPNQREIRLNLA
ncbi:MAG: hypothetical protein AB8F34_02975 [Akkermansiaceae bacterium]